jgi:hypothetical protein
MNIQIGLGYCSRVPMPICLFSEWNIGLKLPPVMSIYGYSFATSGVLIGLSGGSS